jgi:hypothetical protein
LVREDKASLEREPAQAAQLSPASEKNRTSMLQSGSDRSAASGQNRTWAWVSTGVGVVALGVTGVSALMILDRTQTIERCPKEVNERTCPDQETFREAQQAQREIETLDIVALTGTVIGVLGIATGVTLFWLKPADGSAAGIRFGASGGHGRLGLSAEGQF